ncbi:AbfB domain-containing protein [Nocardia sp. NRRL S-836]|uniref:AbfB domain-containing protein n=1 Tax=Nocardia sp. NRRL S-836 TaxID=1519492 RepID=UPI0006AE5528|nr:AbfB domain-containing protein [Nocardia sp. NRRL S-836]
MVEGPVWTKLRGRAEWALHIDHLKPNGGREYQPILTTNPFDVSTYRLQPTTAYSLGGTSKRHGAIMALTAAEESRVLARWPGTPAQRLQSYNFPDRYVRHHAYRLKLHPITTATGRGDATFRLTG